MVNSGLRDVGYNYVVLDDCWAEMNRDSNDMLVEDPVKFPSGMGYVSDQVHNMNMLFGMYSSAGEMTCARYRGFYFQLREYLLKLYSWVSGLRNK
jgi:alpha-galactosidase